MTATKRAPRQRTKSPQCLAFSERLKLAMDQAGIPDRGRSTWIANALGLSEAAGTFTRNGTTMPTSERTLVLADMLRVSHPWLRLGEGPMRMPAFDAGREGLILALVPASSIPDGAVAVGDVPLIPLTMHRAALKQQAQDDAGRTIDPRRSKEDLERTPAGWATHALQLVAGAGGKLLEGRTEACGDAIEEAIAALRSWKCSLRLQIEKVSP